MISHLGWDVIYLIGIPVLVIGPILLLLKLADFIERYIQCRG